MRSAAFAEGPILHQKDRHSRMLGGWAFGHAAFEKAVVKKIKQTEALFP